MTTKADDYKADGKGIVQCSTHPVDLLDFPRDVQEILKQRCVERGQTMDVVLEGYVLEVTARILDKRTA